MSLTYWFPMPIHSIVIFAVWLLLNNSAVPGHILLALLFAIAIPKICYPLQSDQPRVHKPLKIFRYFSILIWDIVIANLRVARLIISPNAKLRPAFIAVPLDIEGALPITLLASTISLTPGTVSADVSEDQHWLYVHVLDMDDEQALIKEIKTRYEAPLMEIFEC
ncbi:Na+/H+ antiporter subunit E [Neptuniibacter sp. CAU 1671]|uniref:Na+/H+ antiporter subunit E n=1 Tax=Neptuniibacter sp. CAU 1671 TaxID=3032593 RepID=UPI0023D9BA92|nr:Na+/H+ antiporter subunit E [Neptuniibacter sp. CAU 1671]MDF2180959.1 Na+/H+ antiporter subunit E [Neptuniibacter sp. CAU 1671]